MTIRKASPEKKATLKSIAADLGITHTTVSNAFINPSKVSEKLRVKIVEHAKSVNYYGPNPAAKYLRQGTCGAIGIVFNDSLSYAFTDPHDLTFLRGVASVCESEGTNLVLIPLDNSDAGSATPSHALVDGYILNAPYKNNPNTQRALSRGLPTVVVDFEAPEFTSVLTNDFEIMHELMEYLIELGHSAIGIVTFPLTSGGNSLFTLDQDFDTDNFVANQRLSGCKSAVEKHRLKLTDVFVQETVNNRQGGQDAARHLLKVRPDITALVCLSDRLAYGAIMHCEEHNLSVPGRVSVTGFDDIQEGCIDQSSPRLTTVRQNAFEKGRQAAKALLKGNASDSGSINIEATLIVRESTAKKFAR